MSMVAHEINYPFYHLSLGSVSKINKLVINLPLWVYVSYLYLDTPFSFIYFCGRITDSEEYQVTPSYNTICQKGIKFKYIM